MSRSTIINFKAVCNECGAHVEIAGDMPEMIRTGNVVNGWRFDHASRHDGDVSFAEVWNTQAEPPEKPQGGRLPGIEFGFGENPIPDWTPETGSCPVRDWTPETTEAEKHTDLLRLIVDRLGDVRDTLVEIAERDELDELHDAHRKLMATLARRANAAAAMGAEAGS